MAVGTYLTRHGVISERSDTSDAGGGRDVAWVPRGVVSFRFGRLDGKSNLEYKRAGWEYVSRILCRNELPKRINGEKHVNELFLYGDKQQYRFEYMGRTYNIVGLRFPMEGLGVSSNDWIAVDLVETPEKIGYQDL